jgi:hypothetical protein
MIACRAGWWPPHGDQFNPKTPPRPGNALRKHLVWTVHHNPREDVAVMHPTQKQAPPVEVTPSFTLRAAAIYLERHGWTQRDYYFNPAPDQDLLPAACVLGAIGMAAHGHEIDWPENRCYPGSEEFLHARRLLLDYLRRTGQASRRDNAISDWNDDPNQTAEAVITALQAAADDWDRIHGGAA